MNMDYVRLTQGLVDKGVLVPVTENIYNRINTKKDYYISLYRYTDAHVKQFEETHTVAGITDVKTNRILFDFDDGQDIENARRDAIVACGRLIEKGIPEDQIRIFFSGNKGFNVEVIFDQEFTRQEFVNMVFGIAGDLRTFDHKINNESRIIRAPLTKHPKSGLYKIPLALSELAGWDMEAISSEAIDATGFNSSDLADKLWTISLPKKLAILKDTEYKKVTSNTKDNVTLGEIERFDIKDIDFTQCPKWMSRERYALQEGFFYGSDSIDKGERNSAFMILAATYKNQGFSADHALNLLSATAAKQAKRTGESLYGDEQLYREIVKPVFSPTWKGGIYGKDEELLILTRARFGIAEPTTVKSDLVGIDNVADDFIDFAKNIDRNTIKTGLKSLDNNVLITSGMMVSLLAAPGAGKTSFANAFVEHLCNTGENTIYFSLDMYKSLLFNRLLQRYSGYDIRKILDMYKNEKPDEKLLKAYSEVLKNYSKANFNFRSGPTVEEIEQEIINYREETGKDAKLVVVDYLEKVRGPFSDATANSAYVASRLSDIAKKYHTTVLLLVQPQKSAGDPREDLASYRKIKGASVIEQDSRVILTMSRPGYNPKDSSRDKYATISVVKNNMGGLCQLDFAWDGISGSLSELDFEQQEDLKMLREELAEQKRKDAKDWSI